MEDVTYTDHHKTGSNRKPVVEIPPRKLLLPVNSSPSSASPRNGKQNWNLTNKSEDDEEHNNLVEKEYCYDSDSDDPYASDHFRMFEFKIRRCTRSRSHDWTDCPFAHPGEKARRRDPRRFQYSGEICPEFRRSTDCSRGDDCEFSHGVFESWLHPIRYRTEACKDGKHCKRKVCFFAHSPRQLRVLLPENNTGNNGGGVLGGCNSGKQRCCLFCHSSSPTSTLLGNLSHLSRSPSVSPPMSPANKAAAFSRLRNRATAAAVTGSVNYKDVLSELVSSLDSISLAEALQVNCSSPVTTPMSTTAANHRSSPLQFALSPSTPSYLSTMSPTPMTSFFAEDLPPRRRKTSDFPVVSTAVTAVEDGSYCDPDLGWVNDLLT